MKNAEINSVIASLQNLIGASKLFSVFINPTMKLIKKLSALESEYSESREVLLRKVKDAYFALKLSELKEEDQTEEAKAEIKKNFSSLSYGDLREMLLPDDVAILNDMMALDKSEIQLPEKIVIPFGYIDSLIETEKCTSIDAAKCFELFEEMAAQTVELTVESEPEKKE